MELNKKEASSSLSTFRQSPITEHIERIYRLKPDSGRLFEDFPELFAYHEMSRRLGELIQYIRTRDTDKDFDPGKSREYILKQLQSIITHFRTKLIRAHVHRHLKIMQTKDAINSLPNSIAIADAQVLVLNNLFYSIDTSNEKIIVQWSHISGVILNGLESVLNVCEAQRTIGYLIYTSADDGKSPYTPIHPIAETREEAVARLRKAGLVD